MRLRTVFVGQVLLLLPVTLAAPTLHRRDQGAASVAKRPRTTQRPSAPDFASHWAATARG